MNDRLYESLPAFYRVRDAQQGEPLRALCAIIQNELDAVRSDIDGAAHNVDVRSVSLGRGKHNIPNIGLFLWRVRAFRLTESPAVAQSSTQYRLSPLGIDSPLYTLPQTQTDITHLATPLDVPTPI